MIKEFTHGNVQLDANHLVWGNKLFHYSSSAVNTLPAVLELSSTLASSHSTALLTMDSLGNGVYYQDIALANPHQFQLETSESISLIYRIESLGWAVVGEQGSVWVIERLDLMQQQSSKDPIFVRKLETGSSGYLSFLTPALAPERVVGIADGKLGKNR